MKETVFCVIAWVQTKARLLSLASFITLSPKVRNILWGVHLEYTNMWTPVKQEMDMCCEVAAAGGKLYGCLVLTSIWPFTWGEREVNDVFLAASRGTRMCSLMKFGKLSWPYVYFGPIWDATKDSSGWLIFLRGHTTITDSRIGTTMSQYGIPAESNT